MSGTNPQDWFLPSSDVRTSPAFTSGNRVASLIDGEAYMAKLRDRLVSVGTGGYIHLAGWRLTPSVRLLGDVPNSPSISEIVTDRASAGVTVRSLLWFVPGTIGNFGASHGQENLDMTVLVEDLGEEAVLDDRLPQGAFASHHHKFVVLGDGTGDFAFIGGIDVALDRWDTASHEDAAGRQPELFEGWHDVQVEVQGPAVGQLWDSFSERWNDPRRPHGAPFTAGGASPASIPASARPASPGQPGTCHVQVIRTYPCRSNGHAPLAPSVYPFAPQGEKTYEAALVHAIDQAEFFVYLEDQYVWPCAVVDALEDAVARGVTVILLVTNNYDVAGLRPFHNFLRHTCLEQLRAQGQSRVFVYHLRQTDENGGQDVYVHSKTVVIDDRYAVVGTANVNRRSMTTDTEIGVAIVDADLIAGQIAGQSLQVCRFAKEYRVALWREHLGLQLDDPLRADGFPQGWPVNADSQVNHARVHAVPQPRFCRPSFIPFVLMNTETTCS
jgi:phosphatidylserine/phosphatidylglycerophosphate/cardiolipin synthase-like enzyme